MSRKFLPTIIRSFVVPFTEAVAKKCSIRKGVLRNFAKFTEKHLCQSLTKETLAQVFSCEFYEISKNTFFTEILWATASAF